MSADAPTPLVLECGPARAEIHPEHGGRLGQLDLGAGPLLRPRAPHLQRIAWGCFPLLPWSNRVPGGRLRFGDVEVRLPVDHDDGSAIHGLVAGRPWTLARATERSATLSVRAATGPYDVRGDLGYELDEDELRLRLAVTNLGPRPVPAGIGIHPWFRSGPVRVPADERWPGEPLPTGSPEPVAGSDDLREATLPRPMDVCFTALTEASADVPGARLSWEGPVTHVVVFSGEPGWVCVEPVTMANDGFGLAERGVEGHGVQVVGPGGSIEVRYRFSNP